MPPFCRSSKGWQTALHYSVFSPSTLSSAAAFASAEGKKTRERASERSSKPAIDRFFSTPDHLQRSRSSSSKELWSPFFFFFSSVGSRWFVNVWIIFRNFLSKVLLSFFVVRYFVAILESECSCRSSSSRVCLPLQGFISGLRSVSFFFFFFFPCFCRRSLKIWESVFFFSPPDNNAVVKKKTRAVEIRERRILQGSGSVVVSVWKRSRGEPWTRTWTTGGRRFRSSHRITRRSRRSHGRWRSR